MEDQCCDCGTTENVKTYRALPPFLGWYNIPDPRVYCDPCLAALKGRNMKELGRAFVILPTSPEDAEQVLE
ncbi:hypothetical protein [Paenibacillus periandrae]|uniref:hypothetical protein n=1 Tax=Paenibacillus periandrae TaxID=1761741 RepID=UPI001F097AD4|nr:hypothetical protein [Paenibacillus periandrae]